MVDNTTTDECAATATLHAIQNSSSLVMHQQAAVTHMPSIGLVQTVRMPRALQHSLCVLTFSAFYMMAAKENIAKTALP